MSITLIVLGVVVLGVIWFVFLASSTRRREEVAMPASTVESKQVGRVTELTVVTPIREGFVDNEYRTYRQRLEQGLQGMQGRINAGIPTPPSLIPTIHFARWFILSRELLAKLTATAVGSRDLLVFTSNFDGDAKQYLRDFSLKIPDDIDRVWSNCDGYPAGGCRDFDAFWTYTRAHQVETLAFAPRYPSVTTQDVLLTFKLP
jgi:hypothetical protein